MFLLVIARGGRYNALAPLLVQGNPMQTQSTLTINRPIADVWNFLQDENNMKKWLSGFKRFERTAGQAGEVGACGKQYYEENDREIVIEEELTHFDPPYRWAGKLTNPHLDSTISYELTEYGDETELKVTNDITFKGLGMKMLQPFLKGSIQKKEDEDLARLKQVLEEEAPKQQKQETSITAPAAEGELEDSETDTADE